MATKRKANELITNFFFKKSNTQIEQSSSICSSIDFCTSDENVENIVDCENVENIENVQNVGNVENIENVQNVGNVENVRVNFHPEMFDLVKFNRSDDIFQDDSLRRKILSHALLPEKSFVYKSVKNRKFRPEWIEKFPWLAYSKSADGVLCKLCFLFVNSKTCGKGLFIEIPFDRWKNAIEKMDKHGMNTYHKI